MRDRESDRGDEKGVRTMGLEEGRSTRDQQRYRAGERVEGILALLVKDLGDGLGGALHNTLLGHGVVLSPPPPLPSIRSGRATTRQTTARARERESARGKLGASSHSVGIHAHAAYQYDR